MKIIRRDLKEGKIKLKPETMDDLWYIKNITSEGDIFLGKSYRRVKDEEKLRADKGERVPINVGVRVRRVEFHPNISRLRVTGVIETGPEDIISMGSYHTLELQPMDVVTILKKRWKKWELDTLEEAEKSAKTPLVLIVGVEEGEAEFALVRGYGIDFTVRVSKTVSGKRVAKEHEANVKEFYTEAAKKLDEILTKGDIKAVIICGPGFAKDNLYKLLKEKYPDVAEISRIESAGTTGRVGIQEVLRRGVIDKIVKHSRISLETQLVDKVFEEIGRDSGLVAYGVEEVKKALDYGAIEKLLIADVLLRKNDPDEMIAKVRKSKGEAVIVSTEHEAGEKLKAIGGMAALLRFRVL
ncbi:MAG: mRNA surveillance protein pelota [Candidatus Hydrothermarchaeaceae archaeon]